MIIQKYLNMMCRHTYYVHVTHIPQTDIYVHFRLGKML